MGGLSLCVLFAVYHTHIRCVVLCVDIVYVCVCKLSTMTSYVVLCPSPRPLPSIPPQ